MQQHLIGQILDKYCTQSPQGLFLLGMPTGFGKTYSVLDFIYKNYRDFASQGRKIFFVTNLKKNLPLQDLENRFKNDGCRDDFVKHVLLIDSNSGSIMENLLSIGNEIPERYTQKHEYKALVSYVNLLSSQKDFKGIKEDLISKIRQDLEPAFRKLIETDLKDKFNDKAKRLAAIKDNSEYQWIGKLYPSVFTDERTIIFLSIDKFLLRNTTLIEKSYLFTERLVANSLIFIDEFDSTKERILEYIIKDGIKDRINLIDLFTAVNNHLNQIKDPKSITEESKWWKEKASQNQNILSPSTILENIRQESKKVFKENNLQHICKSDGEEFKKKRNFLFYDYEFHRVVDIDKKFTIHIDAKKKINWIRASEKNINNLDSEKIIDIRSLIINISSFLTYFQKGIGYLAQNYKHLKEGTATSKDVFTIELSIRTLLNHFNINDKDVNILTSKVLAREINYKSFHNHINTLDSFYENGFCYYDIIDREDHDASSKIQMLEFNRTPEAFLVDLCSKAMVIGVSATANIRSNIANYDLDYLKYRLQSSFISLQEQEVTDLKKSYEEFTNGYKNLDIHAQFVGAKSLEETKKYLIEILDDKEAANSLYTSILHDDNILESEVEFVFSRYVKILKAWKYFLDNQDCHGFLCLLNRFPKSKDSKLDFDKLQEYCQLLLEDNKSKDLSEEVKEIICIVSSDDFDSQKQKFLNDLANGKRRFIISTYQTIGSGQNLQFDIPENIQPICINGLKENKSMDINAIYLEKPTHLITSLGNDNVSDFDFVKHIFQLEFLRQEGAISRNEFKNKLNNAFCSLARDYKSRSQKKDDYTSLYQTPAYSNFLNKVIIQAIGRMCRTNMKSPNIHVLADIEIQRHLKHVNLPSDMILIHEYAALKKAASVPDEFNEDIQIKAFENIASSFSHKTAKFISNSLEYASWTKVSVDRWQGLRQQVLKQPTVINDLQLNEVSEIWRSIYLKLPKLNNFYYYKRETDTDVEVFFSEKKGAYRLDEKSLRLSELMKIKLFNNLFLEKRWATSLPELID